jgi:hypothetical protein
MEPRRGKSTRLFSYNTSISQTRQIISAIPYMHLFPTVQIYDDDFLKQSICVDGQNSVKCVAKSLTSEAISDRSTSLLILHVDPRHTCHVLIVLRGTVQY